MLVRSNGIRLIGDDTGSGAPVLFVHAFPLNRRMWTPQVEALSDRYRCITVDLRGFGESDAPVGPYPLAQLADDLAGLLDGLALDRVTLVGLSMGGYIAFAFWRRHADRLKALVLADTRAKPDSDDVRAGRLDLATRIEREGLAPLAEIQLPRLLSANATPELRQWTRDMIEEATPQGVAGALRGMAARADSSDLLPAIACPTLVLAGALDAVTPATEVRAMAAQLPQATYLELPAAGHLANLEAPEDFNAALRSFLDGLTENQ